MAETGPSPESINITIGFTCVTGELEKANNILNEMIEKLREIQKVSVPVKVTAEADTSGIKKLEESSKAVDTRPAKLLTEHIENLSSKLKLTPAQVKEVSTRMMDLVSGTKTVEMEAKKYLMQLGLAPKEITKLTRELQAAKPEVQPKVDTATLEKVKKTMAEVTTMYRPKVDTSQLDRMREVLGQVQEKFKDQPDLRFSIKGVQEMENLNNLLETTKEKANLTGDSARLLDSVVNKFLRDVEPAREIKILSRDYGITPETVNEIREAAEAVRKVAGASKEVNPVLQENTEKWRMQLGAIRAYRMAGGPVMFLARQMTMQMYWLGIGVMFVGLAYYRVQRAQKAVENSMVSLGRSIRSVRDAQENLQETLVTYGAGTKEARNAAEALIDAEWERKQAEDSLRQSIIQSKIASMSFYLGTIPIGMNVMRTFMDIIGGVSLLNFKQAASEQVKGTAIRQTTEDLYEHVGAQVAVKGAQEAANAADIAEIGIMGGLKGAWEAFKSTLLSTAFVESMIIGLSTMGIGVLIGLASAAIMQSVTMAGVEDEMARYTSQAEDMYKSVDDLIGEFEIANRYLETYLITISKIDPVTGEVIDSFKKATEATGDLSDEIAGRSLVDDLLLLTERTKDSTAALKQLGDTRAVPFVKIPEEITTSIREIGFKPLRGIPTSQNVFNVSFPNLTIRQEADMDQIAYRIQRLSQQNVYLEGGMIPV